MTTAHHELRERLERILRTHISALAAHEILPRDAELATLGLDSMSAVNVMLDIEGEFDVMFPDSMLNEETFRTTSSLERSIQTLLEGRG